MNRAVECQNVLLITLAHMDKLIKGLMIGRVSGRLRGDGDCAVYLWHDPMVGIFITINTSLAPRE